MPRPTSGLVVERRETHQALVTAVALSSGGVWAASAGADGSLAVWDVGSGSCAWSQFASAGRIHSLAFGPGARHVATASADGFRTFDVASGACVASIEATDASQSPWVVLADSSAPIAITRSSDARAARLRRSDGAPVDVGSMLHGVIAIAYDESCDTLLTGGFCGVVERWSAAGECLDDAIVHSVDVTAIAISRDGARIAAGDYDGNLVLLDRELRPLHRVRAHERAITELDWNAVGELACTSLDGRLSVWSSTAARIAEWVQPMPVTTCAMETTSGEPRSYRRPGDVRNRLVAGDAAGAVTFFVL